MKKAIGAILVVGIVLAGGILPETVNATTQHNQNKQVGWVQSNEKWYYYDYDGTMIKGLKKINGEKYFFNRQTGEMMTGWIEDGYDSQTHEKRWFYSDTIGKIQKGWLASNGNWYYLDLYDGLMQTGFQSINGEKYFFDRHGVMQTGWLYDGITMQTGEERWFYFNGSGAMYKGWLHLNGKSYYLHWHDGLMQTGSQIIDGKEYWFNEKGELIS